MTKLPPKTRMPVLFLGHGSPMNAIERNEFSRSWSDLGRCIGKPRAVLMVSAHWQTRGTAVTANPEPRTIHDFGAFPQALFDARYPAPGDAELVAQVRDCLAPMAVAEDSKWGLDHGAWSVLCHLYPEADVPVVQLSMDVGLSPAGHYELGQRLLPLRDKGVLIIGSGNVVHNLPAMKWNLPDEGFDWAQRFQDFVQKTIAAGQDRLLVDYPSLGTDADRSIPTSDHYLPLLYALGARDAADDAVEFVTPKCVYGSLSMMSVALWPSARP
ncbi:4,5-DOPA dioxygenase extradiol [Marinobacter sp. JSM 1782161]|uniref:4,5-DOPA-extradiol-dioxygenase n=1 Tax=Marinobacter sp. JSM 1782161 TaxID=2685906 RepID=UPI001A9E227F|nr:4,5-DOPA dioxygenase extradiol [Marinobacter sp. JSM 1782161]